MRFNTHSNAQDAARIEAAKRKAEACDHSWFTFKPVCRGYHVPSDIEYFVQGCRGCAARRDVMETGEVFRQYIPHVAPENVYIEPTTSAEHYEPRFNGIDAFNESEDTSEPSNLFDRRGGNHGIGD